MVPGLGGAVGAGLGGMLFGGGGGGADRSPGSGMDALAASLGGNANGPVTAMPAYRTAMGEIVTQGQDQARRDTGAAAARGLTGGEFEIAQGANRGRVAAQGQAGAMHLGAQMQGNQQSMLLQLLQQQQANDTARRGQTGQVLGGVAAAGLPALLRLLNPSAYQTPGYGAPAPAAASA